MFSTVIPFDSTRFEGNIYVITALVIDKVSYPKDALGFFESDHFPRLFMLQYSTAKCLLSYDLRHAIIATSYIVGASHEIGRAHV